MPNSRHTHPMRESNASCWSSDWATIKERSSIFVGTVTTRNSWPSSLMVRRLDALSPRATRSSGVPTGSGSVLLSSSRIPPDLVRK